VRARVVGESDFFFFFFFFIIIIGFVFFVWSLRGWVGGWIVRCGRGSCGCCGCGCGGGGGERRRGRVDVLGQGVCRV
jgi:hypothetical protein